jgi:cell division protease FtsH
VHKISIIPRGVGALGYTIQRPTEDRFLMTTGELENKMAVLLGGRAAEHLVFEEISTGAADDLMKVTNIARSMVTRFGMAPALGQVAYEGEQSQFLATPGGGLKSREFSEATAREIDTAVKDLVDRAFAKAVRILTDRRPTLERGAQLLLAKETLGEDDLAGLLGPAPAARAA